MLVAFWLLQAFNTVAGAANAALAFWNLYRGAYPQAVLSSAVCAALVVVSARAWRTYLRMKREDREWYERAERQEVAEHLVFRLPIFWTSQISQMGLDECLKRGVCPDCAASTLDTSVPIVCRNPTCGSRFNVDAKGQWTREGQ